jgi:ABC-type lipoprotein export system ATPase subunit
MTEAIHFENVHKWVGEGEGRLTILNGVSLSVREGEFLAVMGASGSGKSTLLNLIGLLDHASDGTMQLLGQDIAAMDDNAQAALRRESIGFIFQSFNLIPYLSVEENVQLPMVYAHRDHAAPRSLELLSRVGLANRAKAHPTVLSGGERQRVAIARALANDPRLILADEPTGALDSRTGQSIMELIGQVHREGATVILVTHDETIARRAQRVCRMRDGVFQ